MIVNLGTKYKDDRVLKNNKEANSFTVIRLNNYNIKWIPKKIIL